ALERRFAIAPNCAYLLRTHQATCAAPANACHSAYLRQMRGISFLTLANELICAKRPRFEGETGK
ncbi:hypothetical protein, partial [Paenibacillus phoenicis]|uniref:hypothetical protein n=1 Tax=Paenibacillus phoenicis TaxID=554117 RepID=UPI003D2CC2DF